MPSEEMTMAEESKSDSQPHILIIDDDAIIRSVAREFLEEAGFLVSEAEDGIHASNIVGQIHPDIILLDVMMPQMDGFTTCGLLRQLPGCEVTPILMLTALDDIDSINRAYEVGATDFITKPINWVILVQRVRYMTRSVRMLNERKRLEEELQQAQKLEAVATLAGGISHDFNNLLQAIQGFSELLMMEFDKDKFGYQELQEIYAAARRGGELTRQLLTYSRKLNSEKQPIDMSHHVRQVNELLQRVIPKMIEIELRLDDSLLRVHADPVQVEQLLMNLAVNAKDAMPEGGQLLIETTNVTLTPEELGPGSKSAAGDFVLLTVSDNGHGMGRDTLEHIFEPFFSTKAPGKGTGLGLSMVYGIVENHSGHITCHSEPMNGTTFRIYFPIGEPERDDSTTTMPVLRSVPRGEETILLVDDDDPVCRFGKRYLEKGGYTVLTAPDGESALTIYGEKKNDIDLVLLDLIMPGMGGKKCLEKLREIDPELRIVIVSGYVPDEMSMHEINDVACGCLRKPYIGQDLLRTVRRALNNETSGVRVSA